MSMASSSPSSSSSSLRHVLVVGGTGFVGGAMCRSALRRGLVVSSLSRTGRSPYEGTRLAEGQQWAGQVRWCRGDVLSEADDGWRRELLPPGGGGSSTAAGVPPVDAVVSCVGGFGSVAAMRRVNGAANVAVFDAVSRCPDVRRVGFVSAYHYTLPAALQRGYMEGKLAAEASLAAHFPSRGGEGGGGAGLSRAAVVSHTGFLYGSRYLRSLGFHLPLQLIGAPLGLLTDNALVRAVRQAPLVGPLLTPALLPPVSVDALSDAMIDRLMDDALPPGVHALAVEDVRAQQNKTA